MAQRVRCAACGLPVDGGITAETAPVVVEAGARARVAEPAVCGGQDPAAEMRRIIEAGKSAASSAPDGVPETRR